MPTSAMKFPVYHSLVEPESSASDQPARDVLVNVPPEIAAVEPTLVTKASPAQTLIAVEVISNNAVSVAERTNGIKTAVDEFRVTPIY